MLQITFSFTVLLWYVNVKWFLKFTISKSQTFHLNTYAYLHGLFKIRKLTRMSYKICMMKYDLLARYFCASYRCYSGTMPEPRKNLTPKELIIEDNIHRRLR